MSIPFYLVDAFTSRPFSGNPAAVVLLERWPEAEAMQALAREVNLAATCFVLPVRDRWALRWFNPHSELEICGHATLAATHVLARERGAPPGLFRFDTPAGELGVLTDNGGYELSMPRQDPTPIEEPGRLSDALGVRPRKVFLVRKSKSQQVLLVTLPDQAAVERLAPHQAALAAVGVKALIATSKGDTADFVCRYFSPESGVPEDPVTGSAYASLAPFWASRLGRTELCARQVSRRGGDLSCRVFDTRVVLAGEAVTVVRGELDATALAPAG